MDFSQKSIIEAVLFTAGNPVTVEDMAKVLSLTEGEVMDQLQELEQDMKDRHSGLVLRHVAGGYQFATQPDLSSYVKRLGQVTDRRLSAPSMETLSIIAFKQPVTKLEIEQIRGVRVDSAINRLMEMELICEMGRKMVIGRPILYGTTDVFLRVFGLNSLEELPALPDIDEVKKRPEFQQLVLIDENSPVDEEQNAEGIDDENSAVDEEQNAEGLAYENADEENPVEDNPLEENPAEEKLAEEKLPADEAALAEENK